MLSPSLRRAGRYLSITAAGTFWLCAPTIFINDNILETSFVQGASMSPSLCPDYDTTARRDLVLWNKWWSVRRKEDLQRGDVVLFRSPSRPELNAVKRVVATEGDRVVLDPRRRPARKRDGADLPESRGWDAMSAAGGVVVPTGHVWVEGDHWRKSWDSNAYGPISKSLVLGKAVCVVWPLERFGTRPWEEYENRTIVRRGQAVKPGDEMGLVEAIRTG
ncbi:hypothetical protein LTR53_003953 [Teratosphaeriaceae sp. CCFEE 6253]|nr:hypothetical protein LTR53_003953 [Teratosphaeriaceae sp. CCFEE 6253]